MRTWASHPLGEVPEGHYVVPLGKAATVREGSVVYVLAYGTMVHVSLAAIEESGIDAELIDLRSIVPLDVECVVSSVRRTGRCVIVHEASRFGGFGGELSALVQERCFYDLRSPIERVAGWDTPYPHAFEWDYFQDLHACCRPFSAAWRNEQAFQQFRSDISGGIAHAEDRRLACRGPRSHRGRPRILYNARPSSHCYPKRLGSIRDGSSSVDIPSATRSQYIGTPLYQLFIAQPIRRESSTSLPNGVRQIAVRGRAHAGHIFWVEVGVVGDNEGPRV